MTHLGQSGFHCYHGFSHFLLKVPIQWDNNVIVNKLCEQSEWNAPILMKRLQARCWTKLQVATHPTHIIHLLFRPICNIFIHSKGLASIVFDGNNWLH